MDIRKKLMQLLEGAESAIYWDSSDKGFIEKIADHLIAHGVTVQEHCHKEKSVISKTGLMCTTCHSDIDRDAVFCKYCGAKVMPQPPKGD